MEIALLGHMGRDEALADRFVSQGNRLHVIGSWHNPGLDEKAKASGGTYYSVDSITNRGAITNILEHLQPDMFLTNFDDSLAAGIVDTIRQKTLQGNIRSDLLLPCPDKKAARIEWDKFFLREIIDQIDPVFNPLNHMATTAEAVSQAIEQFEAAGIDVAVKPRGLTGGKGVKVMGKQLDSYEVARGYALTVLANNDQTGVEIQEKLEGEEFTLQIFTDGTTIIEPPVTYDYPYREDGDTGPGTGGTGVFTMPAGEQLPFVTPGDYRQATWLTKQVLIKLNDRGIDYKGVIYPTFFKTKNGLKVVEFNARGGEGELVNIVDLTEDSVDFAQVLRSVSEGNLAPDSVRYQKLASTLVYLMAPEYAYTEGPQYKFQLNRSAVAANDCLVRFAAAESMDLASNTYRSVGSSRTVGLLALGATPWDARDRIHAAIKEGFGLDCPMQYRQDIGDKTYIESLGTR